MKTFQASVVLFLLSILATQAAEPAWWGQRGVKTAAPASNKSPANLGQLKWMAKQAKLEFDSKFASYGGAGVTITQLVNGFQAGQLNYAPANQGQLKAVAKLYYDRLLFLGFDTRQSLRDHGAPSWGYFYPWTSETTDDSHFSPAQLGQLKWVFSFDLNGFTPDPAYLNSGTGVPVWWQSAQFGGVVTPDPEGDFFSKRVEFLSTTPTASAFQNNGGSGAWSGSGIISDVQAGSILVVTPVSDTYQLNPTSMTISKY